MGIPLKELIENPAKLAELDLGGDPKPFEYEGSPSYLLSANDFTDLCAQAKEHGPKIMSGNHKRVGVYVKFLHEDLGIASMTNCAATLGMVVHGMYRNERVGSMTCEFRTIAGADLQTPSCNLSFKSIMEMEGYFHRHKKALSVFMAIEVVLGGYVTGAYESEVWARGEIIGMEMVKATPLMDGANSTTTFQFCRKDMVKMSIWAPPAPPAPPGRERSGRKLVV